MARTLPPAWPSRLPVMTPEHAVTLHEWHEGAQADEDVATDPADNAYYEGRRLALEDVLCLLYGLDATPPPTDT